jgi:hypothetical protein
MQKILFTTLALFLIGSTSAQLQIDLESGAAKFGYNDVRIPGKKGTFFSLKDDFKNNFSPFFRARLQYSIGKRHSILALYAPLTVESEGTPAKIIYFQDQVFEPGNRIHSRWKFNSYRLSYQYNLIRRERLIFAIGLTGKIRDAKIELTNSVVSARKTNIGFVPLIRFYMDVKFREKFHLIADGDALVAKQGRAEDVLFAFGYDIGKHIRIKLGYRLLEGGADNDEVYNFSSLHYMDAGITLSFK